METSLTVELRYDGCTRDWKEKEGCYNVLIKCGTHSLAESSATSSSKTRRATSTWAAVQKRWRSLVSLEPMAKSWTALEKYRKVRTGGKAKAAGLEN